MTNSKKFTSPCPLPAPHEREILTVLIEEAAEVIQRATKMLRFGVAEIQPGQSLTNRERLSLEIGDLLTMIDRAVALDLINPNFVQDGRQRKKEKLAIFLQSEWPL